MEETEALEWLEAWTEISAPRRDGQKTYRVRRRG